MPAPPRGVALAALGDTLEIAARIDLAPAEINHLHAGGSALAVLVHTESRWQVIVFEESGAERWRVDVPVAYAHDGSAHAFGYVAISDERVALLKAGSDALLAWDAATGKPVG